MLISMTTRLQVLLDDAEIAELRRVAKRHLASMRAPDRDSNVEPSVVGNRVALAGRNADGAPVVSVYRFSRQR